MRPKRRPTPPPPPAPPCGCSDPHRLDPPPTAPPPQPCSPPPRHHPHLPPRPPMTQWGIDDVGSLAARPPPTKGQSKGPHTQGEGGQSHTNTPYPTTIVVADAGSGLLLGWGILLNYVPLLMELPAVAVLIRGGDGGPAVGALVTAVLQRWPLSACSRSQGYGGRRLHAMGRQGFIGRASPTTPPPGPFQYGRGRT